MLAVVGGLVGLVFAVVLFAKFGPDTSASSQLRGFTVLSDRSVRVEVEVARSPGTAVFCVLRARGADGTEVGRLEVDVQVSTARTSVVAPEVPTSARAVTGELVGCQEGTASPPP